MRGCQRFSLFFLLFSFSFSQIGNWIISLSLDFINFIINFSDSSLLTLKKKLSEIRLILYDLFFPLSQSRKSRGASSREDRCSEKDAGSREKRGEQRHVDRPHNTSACKAISVRARGGLRHVTASIHSGPYGMVSYESQFFRYMTMKFFKIPCSYVNVYI